jgi:hypothetical protein
MTNAYSNTPFGRENWAEIRALADKRHSRLFIVVLDRSIEENTRRLQSPDRKNLQKLVDPATLIAARANNSLLDDGGDYLLRLDTTGMTPAVCADKIAASVQDHSKSHP